MAHDERVRTPPPAVEEPVALPAAQRSAPAPSEEPESAWVPDLPLDDAGTSPPSALVSPVTFAAPGSRRAVPPLAGERPPRLEGPATGEEPAAARPGAREAAPREAPGAGEAFRCPTCRTMVIPTPSGVCPGCGKPPPHLTAVPAASARPRPAFLIALACVLAAAAIFSLLTRERRRSHRDFLRELAEEPRGAEDAEDAEPRADGDAGEGRDASDAEADAR